MKIGLMGGTFDPPHIAHLIGARRALEQLKLDRVIFVPNNIPPHKPSAEAGQIERLEMVKLAIEGEKNFEVSDFEIKSGGISYTFLTVEHFYKQKNEIYLLIGEDSIKMFHKWKNYEIILKMAYLAWLPRIKGKIEEDEISPEILKRSIRIDSEIIQISSTKIKELIKNGLSIKWIVPDKVIEYIYEKKLYLTK